MVTNVNAALKSQALDLLQNLQRRNAKILVQRHDIRPRPMNLRQHRIERITRREKLHRAALLSPDSARWLHKALIAIASNSSEPLPMMMFSGLQP